MKKILLKLLRVVHFAVWLPFSLWPGTNFLLKGRRKGKR